MWRLEKLSPPSKGMRIGFIRCRFRRMEPRWLPHHGDGTVKLVGCGYAYDYLDSRRACGCGLFGVVFAGWATLASGSWDGTIRSCGMWRLEKLSPPSKGMRIGFIRCRFRRMGPRWLPHHGIVR